jgi:hypothetical protein
MDDDQSADNSRFSHGAAGAIRSGGKWLAALVVASLVLPALTTQWSDRQNELSLKEALVSQLTLSAATAIEEAHALVLDETVLDPLPTERLRARYVAIAKAWNIEVFTLESKLNAYFPDARLREEPHQGLGDALGRYNLHVQDFILLSGDICSDNRVFRLALGRLERYLPGIGEETWEALRSSAASADDLHGCWKRTEEFRRAFQEPLGRDLLEKRQSIVETIIHSGAEGYSVGFRDFLRQILPPL